MSRLLISCFVSLLLLSVSGLANNVPSSLPAWIEQAETGTLTIKGESIHTSKALPRFYREREYQAAWLYDGGELLQQLQESILKSAEQGLNPADYHLAALQEAIDRHDTDAIELLATDAYLTLAAHIVGGQLNPETFEPDWTANRRERDLVRQLETALEQRNISHSLVELEPDSPGYALLKAALQHYRQILHKGGWQPIDNGKALKKGDSGPRVDALIARLKAGEWLAQDSTAGSFDAEVELSVSHFQRLIGLEADGVVGADTLRELNKTARQRVGQIMANLERWRWLPENLGKRHIRVNVADYQLVAYDDGKPARVHDVIVGRTYRQTPVFSGLISYMIFNPWWETPDKLARLDKLPAFQKNPEMVSRLGFEVLDRQGNPVDPAGIDWHKYSSNNFPFRLRQRPGPENALGQVKIMFPNKHDVYLHDTPSRNLFMKTERAFSSGCIRVANVLELASWLLSGSADWNREKIDRILASGNEVQVNLPVKVPVYILYFTAVTGIDGNLRLINDIYQRDETLIKALQVPELVM
jgi:murein L,D-transpeptidase YcbB/YkuD